MLLGIGEGLFVSWLDHLFSTIRTSQYEASLRYLEGNRTPAKALLRKAAHIFHTKGLAKVLALHR